LKTRRNELDGLNAEDLRMIIKQTFKKLHVYAVILVGIVPLMPKDTPGVFCE
jgi:hypothetical protein